MHLLHYEDHVSVEEVRVKIQQIIGTHEDLTIVKRRELKCYGYVCRSSGLAKTTLQGTLKGERRRGRQKKEMGKQHQGMDRPGLEWTGFEVTCDASMTLALKG